MIISVLNQKGGVGKTTTTLNLGAALTRASCRMLLVDLDPQESLLKFDSLDDPNVRIVGATPKTLAKVLESGNYDFALLDCPPILAQEAAAALKVTQLAIAPTPPRFLDVAGFALLCRTVQEAAARGNPKLRLKLLVTMSDARLSVHHEYEEKLRQAFRGDIFETTIPRAGVFDKAADANTSVFGIEPRSASARAFESLAKEILDYEHKNK